MITIRFNTKDKTWKEPQGRFIYQLIHRAESNDYELVVSDLAGARISLGELDSYATGATRLVKKHLASNK